MPQRPDLRQIAGNIGEALADFDRDALLAILTYVFKEYVVEGPPPMLVNQAERLEDLEGFSFAQLITALQTRLDHSELSLLKVDGETVSVRVDGVLHPLTLLAAQNASRRGPATQAPAALARQTAAAAPQAPPQRPGVRVVETTLTRRPSTPGERVTVADAVERGRSEHAGGPPSAAPRPRRGLSVGARPQSGGGSMIPGGGRSDSSSSESSRPEPAPPPPEAPEDTGDDSSIRFSLLEFD